MTIETKDDNSAESKSDKSKPQSDIGIKPKREKKKIEYTGSRWAGIILLLATIVFSLLFYAKGRLGEKGPGIGEIINKISTEIFGQKTYTFEK